MTNIERDALCVGDQIYTLSSFTLPGSAPTWRVQLAGRFVRGDAHRLAVWDLIRMSFIEMKFAFNSLEMAESVIARLNAGGDYGRIKPTDQPEPW